MGLTFQDIAKRRQQSEFVGREEQLVLFQNNLLYSIDDERRRFIIDVYGQGGVGKTTLLTRFRKVAEDAQFLTVYTNENDRNIPQMLNYLARQFADHGHPLKTFAERYKLYLQIQEKIQEDLDQPDIVNQLFSRAAGKSVIVASRATPVTSIAVDLIGAEVVEEQVGKLSNYLFQKLKSKDEVQLMLEPEATLTPLFLEDLGQIANNYSIGLFFDTYEWTGEYLQSWLREVLEGLYGSVPANILIVIGGRYELDHNYWSPFEGLIARISLEPFTPEEARTYLARKGISDEKVVEVILRISGSLPLLVATLATESPTDPSQVGDPSGEAIDRFLKWVDDPQQRQLALDAALPRYLNKDTVTLLTNNQKVDTLFDWLQKMPFIQKHVNGWRYHPIVREQMLRYKRQRSPQEWADLHSRLAAHYEKLQEGLGLDETSKSRDKTWQTFSREVVYHRICQLPQKYLLKSVMKSLSYRKEFRQQLAEAIQMAGEDTAHDEALAWGDKLQLLNKAWEKDEYQSIIDILSSLISKAESDNQELAEVLSSRGDAYIFTRQLQQALDDFSQAIELDSSNVEYVIDRGMAHFLMENYEAALTDFNHVLELDIELLERQRVLVFRSTVYVYQQRYNDALDDCNQAHQLAPDEFKVLALRSHIYGLIGRYDDALADCDRAIELEPNNSFLLALKLRVLVQKRDISGMVNTLASLSEQAPDLAERMQEIMPVIPPHLIQQDLENFVAALGLDAGQASVATNQLLSVYNDEKEAMIESIQKGTLRAAQALEYSTLDPQEALAKFNQILEIDPDNVSIIINRGEIYRWQGEYSKALADFDRVLEINSNDIRTRCRRGETYLLMGDYQLALTDFEDAINLIPERTDVGLPVDWLYYQRSLVYLITGQPKKAELDITKAISIAQKTYKSSPERWPAYFNLLFYYLASDQTDEAEHLCYQALDNSVPQNIVRHATMLLDIFLRLFPDNSSAQTILDLFKNYLENTDSQK